MVSTFSGHIPAAVVLSACLLFTHSADASQQRFDLKWGGLPGQPTAIGHVVLDTAVLPSTAPSPYPASARAAVPSTVVTELTLTVTGSLNGDGTFGIESFESISFWTPGGIDLTKELVGQQMGNGWIFGMTGEDPLPSGDFALTSRDRSSTTPLSTWYYILSVGDRSGSCCQQLQLVSMLPIPEPGTAALLLLGLAVFSRAVRRRPGAPHQGVKQAARGATHSAAH